MYWSVKSFFPAACRNTQDSESRRWGSASSGTQKSVLILICQPGFQRLDTSLQGVDLNIWICLVTLQLCQEKIELFLKNVFSSKWHLSQQSLDLIRDLITGSEPGLVICRCVSAVQKSWSSPHVFMLWHILSCHLRINWSSDLLEVFQSFSSDFGYPPQFRSLNIFKLMFLRLISELRKIILNSVLWIKPKAQRTRPGEVTIQTALSDCSSSERRWSKLLLSIFRWGDLCVSSSHFWLTFVSNYKSHNRSLLLIVRLIFWDFLEFSFLLMSENA